MPLEAPQAPTEDDLLDEYKRSLKSAGAPPGPEGDDLLDEYKASQPRRMEPVVVNAPVMGRSPFGPEAPPPPAPIRMPPVVVRPPAPPTLPAPRFGGPVPSARTAPPLPPPNENEPADFGTRLAEGAAGLLTHPQAVVEAPIEALGKVIAPGSRGLSTTERAYERARFGQTFDPGETPTTGERALGAAQLGATAAAGPVSRATGRVLAPWIGSRLAAIFGRGATGAGVGALFSPNDPAVGAALGGGIAGVEAVASGARQGAVRRTYTGEAESPDVRPRIGQAPEQPPAKPRATGRVVEEPAPATAEPDFTVEDSPLLKQYMEETGKKPVPAPEPAPVAPAAEPVSSSPPITTRQPEPLTPFDTPKVMAARARAAEIPETAAIATPEREAMRQDIAKKLYGQGAPKQGKEAYIVLGPAGAGKTSSFVTPLAEQTGSIVLDPDDAKKLLPEYENGIGANSVHKESSSIREQMLRWAVSRGDNLIMPTLGSNPEALHKTIDQLEAGGYTVHVRLVDVPKEVAAQRAIHRYEHGGHFVEPSYILQVGDRSRATYEALKGRQGIQSYEAYDNHVEHGQPPRLIERTEGVPRPTAPEAAVPSVPGAGVGPGSDRRGPAGSGQAGQRGPEEAGEAPPSEVAPHGEGLLDEFARVTHTPIERLVQRIDDSYPAQRPGALVTLADDVRHVLGSSKPFGHITAAKIAEEYHRLSRVPEEHARYLHAKRAAPTPATATKGPPAPKHEFSSTQLDLPPETAKEIRFLGAGIPVDNLAEDGRETKPHITVKYGLHGDDPEKVRALLADEPPVTVTLGKTSFFPNGESNAGDVLKVDVDSPALHRLNQKIADALPHTDTHPEYKPHATIAYLKPGLGKRYAGRKDLEGHTVTIDRLTFSDRNGQKTEIPLGGKSVGEEDEGLSLRRKYRPDLVDEYQRKGVAGQITPDVASLLHNESESLESEGEAAPGPTEEDEADRRAPVVQRTIEEEGKGASEGEVRKLAEYAERLLKIEQMPQGALKLRQWAADVIGRPYESRTWKMDDVYDALEGAANKVAREELGPAIVGAEPELDAARRLETQTFKGRLRSSGMVARQQFSTPLPIARAAQIAADVAPGEKVLEPTAGTGNLVNFLRDADVKLDVNELEPRRAAVLRWLGLDPTMEDALRLPLNGKRYNVVITNPPYGSASVGGKYTGFGATPFNATDIAQRFVAAALAQLVDGGRLVAVMPPNTLKPMSAPFRKWLAKEHTPVAYIESPPGAYAGRGTNTGTVLLVVDKGKVQGGPEKAIVVGSPTWARWEEAIREIPPRAGGHEPAVDVAPVRQEPKAPAAPKKQAELISREPSPTIAEEAPSNGPVPESQPAERGGVVERPGETPGRSGRAAPVRGIRPERPAPESRGGGEPGPGRPADVVAEAGSGQPSAPVEPKAPRVVPEVPRGPVVTDAARAREREREIAAATASPVFAPYSLGTLDRRSPHPRLVVETRAMAGMPAPATSAKITSKLLDNAWGRDGAKGGLSDEQADAVLRALTAWDQGHGFLASDDVGVGKTREAAGLVLEAIERGAKRILYTTKNENNVADAMREFRLVASGVEDGDFPAEMVFVGDYKKVKSGEESLPVPDRPTIYFAHSYNFKDFAPALAEVKPTVWIADEAHEFKNQFTDRGAAWQGLHKDVLERNGHVAYFTATPAVTLDELGYLYGLKEWPIGGFADWVDRKLGHAPPLKPGEQASGAGALSAAEASEKDLRALGERTGAFSDEASDLDKNAKTGKKKFMRGRPDVFQSKVTPAETEQVMRELKGAGKYIARDLWRGGVKFDVHEVDLLGNTPKAVEQRALYDQAAELTRDISLAARKFGRMNQKVKTAGLDRALIQSYLKQLLFGLRLPTVLAEAEKGLKAGDQVVISLHSVTGDADIEDGVSADDAEAPMNERLRSAINRINTQHVEKQGSGDETEYVDLGEIPEAIMVRSDLTNRLQALPPLIDPVRAIEDKFGAKNVAVITGKRSAKQRKLAMGEFQSGTRKLAVISKAGKVGISLHDVNGARRRMLVADYEWSADTFKQELGRVDRTGQRSSPHVSLVASNLAGERKFAATIAARMASLGATSKGSAESTGTDALDQFDVSDGVSLAAMRNAVTKMDHATRGYFTGSQFAELHKVGPQSWEIIPKKTPDSAGMRDFLLELLMFPVRSADEVWKQWAIERDALRTGEAVEEAAARRTGRAKGSITRQTLLTAANDPPMTVVEMKNEAGEKRGVLQGFVTQYISEIQEARGLESSGATKSRRYVHVTTPEGQLVSGLELNPGEIRRVKQAFGKGERKTMTPAEAWTDLQTGDRVAVRGAGGDRWVLRQRRDGRVQIDGATIAKQRAPLQGLVRFETVGNFLYVPGEEAAVTKFLERFPPIVEGAKGASDVPATGEEGTMGGTVDLHSFADPFTAALQMLRAARKLHAQRMAAQAKGAAAAAKAARPKKLTKKQRRALLQTGPTAGPYRDVLQRVFVPGARSEGAGRMSRLKAHELAKMAHENEQAIEWLEKERDTLDKLPAHSAKGVKDYQGPRWQWAFDMQAGRPILDPKLAKLGLVTRQLLDEGRDRVQALGTGKLAQFYQNYMPQAWEDVNAAADWYKRVLGKRPLEGPKAFLHRKTIASLEDGILAGRIPASDNPLDLVVFKLREMNKYVTWHRIFQQGRKEGLFKFFRPRQLPRGWQWIDDNMAIVYAPRTDQGALAIRGQYAAPEPIATIVHNYLRPGLRGNPWYDSYMRLGGSLNLFQLGWSAFHLGFVAFDATISTGAAGLEELLTKGQRLRGLGHLGIAAASMASANYTVIPVVAPALNYLSGRKVIQAYRMGTLDPGMQETLDGLIAGGGRISQDRFYRTGYFDDFRKALRDHRWVTAGLELPFAATELAMRPLLEHIVPAMKAGAFRTLWAHEVAKLPAGATQDDVDRAAKLVWDSIDNRLGQMVYDNLDWRRVHKDIFMGAIRSVGWNAGDVRELGGAGGDLARTRSRVKAGGPIVTHRMAYAVMLATLVGLYGAIYTYLHTGDLPGEEDGEYRGFGLAMKDLYFPRTGEKNPEGQWERMTPPTYVKDVAGVARHPFNTIAHKVHPFLNMLYELAWSNEDFYGDQIRNTQDPWYEQAREAVNYVFRTGVPFAVRNYQEEKKREGGKLSKAEGFLGVTAAPREVVRSPAENEMQEAIRARMPAGGTTPEKREASQKRAELARAVREGQLTRRQAIDSARTLGILKTGQQAHILARMGKEQPLVRKFKMLTAEEAERVYADGTPEQQKLWNPYLRLKQARARLPLTPRLAPTPTP